ncbi:hypothetical protein HHL17_09230 [Chitinophaga sp. G-6-1-13]|uniref:Uncharacterized protein n=1 Tax=Chitinophaga fulva TaxID=2728842 RepID=A0A848GHT1_9BACT|nr:hypothetical protein [Chitinophaga fulva]NML37377.1 hypothetical protein [Chitinophaga fulva]
MKDTRKSASRWIAASYILAILPLLLLTIVFTFAGAMPGATGISRQELAHGIVQVLIAVTVGLAGVIVR